MFQDIYTVFQFHFLLFISIIVIMPPALDLDLVSRLGHDLHPHPGSNGLGEGEVCPWTLFLTMALTLLKGKRGGLRTHSGWMGGMRGCDGFPGKKLNTHGNMNLNLLQTGLSQKTRLSLYLALTLTK